MTAHVLIDDWLYVDMNGQCVSYGQEEVRRSSPFKGHVIEAAFIDCETKLAGDGEGFSADYFVQQEHMDDGKVQLVGAKRKYIEEIYANLKPSVPARLIPYPIAIRAFLKAHALLPEGRIIIFVDDLKTQAVITLFEGMRFTSPRKIGMKDLGYLASQIRRSLQAYEAQQRDGSGNATSFLLVSNNKEWLSAFIEHGLVSGEELAHVPVPYPALEGLKTAKFALHFILPEALALQRRKQARKQYLIYGSILAASAVASLGLYWGMALYGHNSRQETEALRSQKQRLLEELQLAHQRKLAGVLASRKGIAWGEVYADFFKNIPFGYVPERVSIQMTGPGKYKWQGMIVPREDHAVIGYFQRSGLFADARITPVLIDKKLSQQVDLALSAETI